MVQPRNENPDDDALIPGHPVYTRTCVYLQRSGVRVGVEVEYIETGDLRRDP